MILQRASKSVGQALASTSVNQSGKPVNLLAIASSDLFCKNSANKKRTYYSFYKNDDILELGYLRRTTKSTKILGLEQIIEKNGINLQQNQYIKRYTKDSSFRNILQKRLFHSSPPFELATIVKEVPSMGDSITEGTLIEWSKNVGDAVNVDDVVCIVETDKVSVDIRSEDAGVLVEIFADIDSTVEVGKPLFSLDTEGTATINSNTTKSGTDIKENTIDINVSQPVSNPPVTSVSSVGLSSVDAGPSGYVPSIQFRYGKRERKEELPSSSSTPKIPPSSSHVPIKHTPGAKDFIDMPTMYGRPTVSLEEMDAIDSGGAF